MNPESVNEEQKTVAAQSTPEATPTTAPAQPAQVAPQQPVQQAQPVAEATTEQPAPAAAPVQPEAQPAPAAAAPAPETPVVPVETPAAPAQPATQPEPVVQPAAQPAPQPQTVPQPAAQPAPQPQTVPQPAAQPAPAATPVAQPVAQAAPAQPAVQDIQPAAPLNPLANDPGNASLGSGLITPSNTLNSYDNTNIGFVPVGEAMPKKKNKALKWTIIIVILVSLGLLGYFVIYPYVYRTYMANPKNVYDAVVKESFKQISNTVTETIHTRSIYDLQFSFDSNVESLQDYIGYTYGVNIGADPDDSSIQTGITIKGKDNVEHSYYSYVKDKKEYKRLSTYRELIYAGEANMKDKSNLQISYEEILKIASKMDSTKINYLVTKVGDLVAGSISADKLIKEDASITINGQVTKVISNKYTVNNEVISNTLAYIKDGILKDDKALEILVELTGTEKDQLKRQIEEINTKVTPLKSDENIVISIFTAGLKNEIVGYELSDNKYEGNVHYYKKDDFFEFKGHALIKDEETGKEISHNILAIGNKVEGKTKIGVKYNDEDVAGFVLNTWDEKTRDVDYDIKVGEKNYKGNLKFAKDVNQERGKYTFAFSVNVGKEYIRFDINFDNTWSADVANIMMGSAKTLSDEEIAQREQEFIQNLQNTPIYKLFSTTDGNFDKSILDYYNNAKKTEPPVEGGQNPQPNPTPSSDYCLNLDANGNYVDENANCQNFVCTITINGETTTKQCNVA